VVRTNSPTTIAAATQHSAAQFTPWEGRRVDVSVVHTILRGRFAVRDGELTTHIGGEFVARPRSGSTALDDSDPRS